MFIGSSGPVDPGRAGDCRGFTCATADTAAFQTALRKLLPPPYLISHGMSRLSERRVPFEICSLTLAPQAPHFQTEGAYSKVHAAVGSGIDWYNVQFYNQGGNAFDTCAVSRSLFWVRLSPSDLICAQSASYRALH